METNKDKLQANSGFRNGAIIIKEAAERALQKRNRTNRSGTFVAKIGTAEITFLNTKQRDYYISKYKEQVLKTHGLQAMKELEITIFEKVEPRGKKNKIASAENEK